MKDITTIFFDMGRVLVTVDEERALVKIAKATGKSSDKIWDIIQEHRVLNRYGSGQLTPKEFHAEIISLFGIKEDFNTFMEQWKSIIVGPKKAVVEIATSLKGKYKLFVLSNTDGVHHAYIRTIIPLDDIFDGQVVSYLVGAEKPSKKIYQAALNMADEKPEHCIFIDDLEENIAAARKAGMQGIVFKGDVKALKQELKELGVEL